MSFWKKEKETALTQAVIDNDVEAVAKLKESKEHVLAKNFLGFNAVDLARVLDRPECLEILEPQPEKIFVVKGRGDSKAVKLSQEEFEEFFCLRYLRHLRFDTYKLFKEVIEKTSKIFFYEAENVEVVKPKILEEYVDKPEIFTLRTRFFAERIYSGYVAPVAIEWIDDVLEYGLLADRKIKKGEFVAKYVGDVRRTALWLTQNEHSLFYPNQSWSSYVIDSQKEGNELRFCNHSFEPNLTTKAAADKGLIHCLFLAERDIEKGEQLTWNYGEEFWSQREPPQEI